MPNEVATEQLSRPATFGEQAVGLSFNPSNDAKVDKVKKLFAEVIDILNDHDNEQITGVGERSELYHAFYTGAFHSAINAQMAAVKLLTWKL